MLLDGRPIPNTINGFLLLNGNVKKPTTIMPGYTLRPASGTRTYYGFKTQPASHILQMNPKGSFTLKAIYDQNGNIEQVLRFKNNVLQDVFEPRQERMANGEMGQVLKKVRLPKEVRDRISLAKKTAKNAGKAVEKSVPKVGKALKGAVAKLLPKGSTAKSVIGVFLGLCLKAVH